MRLQLGACIARNDDPMIAPDFTSDAFATFATEVEDLMGVDVTHLVSSADDRNWETFEIDADQLLYTITVDARAIRDIWCDTTDMAYYNHMAWLNESAATPYEWMTADRGEQAYWLLGFSYTIGITQFDIENAIMTP